MNKSDTIGSLAAALSKAQGQMTFASKDASNPHFKSRYADLAAIVDAIREPLSSNGLSFSQLCDFTDNGGLIIETLLMHESGEWIAGRMQMPVPKNDPQGIGSATTYGKRYCLAAIVGIAADEDDDGEAAMGRGQQQKQQGQQKSQQKAAEKQQEVKEPTDARIKLKEALAATFHGNLDEMSDALRTYSSFDGKGKDGQPEVKFLTLANLDRPTDNEKMHKWFGSALGKLRKDQEVTEQFNQHRDERLSELKKDMGP